MDNDWKKHSKKATTITIGNHKGGVGKTTNTILLAYALSCLGIKVLAVDMDSQANTTKSLMLTKYAISKEEPVTTITNALMTGILQNDLSTLPVKIMDNLFLIPSYIDFEEFPKYLYRNFSDDEAYFLMNKLIEPMKQTYDMILIDVPPMNLAITNNAIVASDYVLISLQTQESSLQGAENYVSNLLKLRDMYKLDVDLIGFLPVLFKTPGKVDDYILDNAKKMFGEDLIFQNIVPNMERIKRFFIGGIRNEDRHDRKVLDLYEKISLELLEKLRKLK